MNILNAGVDSAKHDIQELVEGLQTERGQSLAGLRQLQLATRLLAQAEGQRLARRNPVDPRLAPLATLERSTRERLAVLDVEIEVAAIRVTPVRKTEALLHGRVTDEARRAVGRLSLVLLDANGRAVPGVPPVQADEAGYYAFVIGPEAAATLGNDTRLSVAVQRGDAQVQPKGGAGFTLARGSVAVKDLALSGAELDKLQLRASAAATITRPSTSTTSSTSSTSSTSTTRPPARAPAGTPKPETSKPEAPKRRRASPKK